MTTRERLSTHAARLFAERGYHGTSVNDLASALGIQKSSIYAHIGNKEDLLAEIALGGAGAFHAALDAVPADALPAERLRLALHAHLDIVKRQLEVATVWLQEWRFLNGEPRAEFLRQRRAYERRIAGLFRDAIRAGALREDLDVKHAVLLLLSAANWTYTWFNARTDVDEVCERYWDLLLNGMAAPRPRRRRRS